MFVPKTTGADYDLPEELQPLARVKQHINVYTNFNAFRDSAPNLCHYTGWIVCRSGIAPIASEDKPGETIDVTIARTHRPQLALSDGHGDRERRHAHQLQLRERQFGQRRGAIAAQPVHAHLRPGLPGPERRAASRRAPLVMARKSVLSGVLDQTRELAKVVGAEDRARLDQYFTGLRDLERQFDQQLTKPEPIAACHAGRAAGPDPRPGIDADIVAQRHRQLTDLMVMALVCDQTRVFNMAYSAAFASTIKPGYEKPHHTTTHEEPIDKVAGYQPIASWFMRRAMEEWAYFVEAFAKVREGDGTLLDNTLIYASTDSNWARIHSIDGIPMFTAGRAGGRVRTGTARRWRRNGRDARRLHRDEGVRRRRRLLGQQEQRHLQRSLGDPCVRSANRRDGEASRRSRSPRRCWPQAARCAAPAEPYIPEAMPPGFRVETSELDGPVFADREGPHAVSLAVPDHAQRRDRRQQGRIQLRRHREHRERRADESLSRRPAAARAREAARAASRCGRLRSRRTATRRSASGP